MMKANILIVEDEEALVLLLRYNLEAEGYGVDTVARGDEADLLLKHRSPDLVCLDRLERPYVGGTLRGAIASDKPARGVGQRAVLLGKARGG